MIKLLIGGSPCTHWSIAQSKNRETTAEGLGWELFRNFLLAKEGFKPDLFLYENNKSAAQAIKDQISLELGAPLQYINSALVSAQNRQRFYCHNFGEVPQPEDRGILLRDILESGIVWQDKSFAYTTRCTGAIIEDTLKKHRHTMVAERVGTLPDYPQQAGRIYGISGKSVTLKATDGGGGAATGLYAIPIEAIANTDKHECLRATYFKSGLRNFEKKLTDGMGYQGVCVRLGVEFSEEPKIFETENGKRYPIYKVCSGTIFIKGGEYPVRLPDGYYIIRKLTVTEACRLQTMPDDYCRAVSATQAYKGLGNGWTAEVIIHLLRHALAGVPLDEEIVVLSMYDGIGTGRYCLDKLGYKNVTYYAHEIDKYAMQVAESNFPDIIQCGDAFQVRERRYLEGLTYSAEREAV